jgi:hypothetical protein
VTITLPPLLSMLGIVLCVIIGIVAGLIIDMFAVALTFDRWDPNYFLLFLPPIAGAIIGYQIGVSLL